MRDAVVAYIGLGANLGDACASVRLAMQAIAETEGVAVEKESSFYGSAPVDSSGPDYVNAVVAVRTVLTAPSLLAQLQAIELRAGRERPYRNAPRTLDLDLLLYGQATIHSATLCVPHPRMGERAFVLVPLHQIAPHCVTAGQLERVAAQAIRRI
jgi:2-amino-4-hydroxy-6-hydroxymethyldihydropteridine diphosphokinase